MKQKTPRELKKEIRETARKEMRAKYEKERDDEKLRYQDLWQRYEAKCDEAHKLSAENAELKEKLAALEDWNHRLMEFMDMPEDERKNAIKRYVADSEFETLLNNWLLPKYSAFFNILG